MKDIDNITDLEDISETEDKPLEDAVSGDDDKPAEDAVSGNEDKPAEDAVSGNEDKPAEDTGYEEELYKDDVYKEDEDQSDEDMEYLDLSSDTNGLVQDEKDRTDLKKEKKEKTEKKKQEKKEKKEKEPIKAGDILIPWLLVILGAAVLVSLTFNNNVWLDEAFTASLVNADMAEVLRRSMADTLPPLYNILLKLSTDFFGYNVTVMKLTSAVPMILTMILGATVVRKRHGLAASCMFILALIVMPNMLFYSVEIRMYSLGFLFATSAGIFADVLVEKGGKINWILFTLSTVLAGYSHHFAFVTAGLIYLFLLIHAIRDHKAYREDLDKKKHPVRIGSFFACLFATFILYFPCLLVTLNQLKSVSGYFSMPEITPAVFIKYCRYPFTVGFTPLSIMLLVLTAFLFIKAFFRGEKTTGDFFNLYCFLLYYMVLLFGTAISKIMTANIFVDRYLFFALGLMWLFFAVEASSLKKWAIYFILIFETVIGIYSYTNAYASEYAPGAGETISWLYNNTKEGDALYTLEESEELAWCLPFYSSNITNYEDLDEALAGAEGHNVWVAVLNGYDKTEEYDSYVKEIENLGYGLEYISEFRFDRYMFKMYKLKE